MAEEDDEVARVRPLPGGAGRRERPAPRPAATRSPPSSSATCAAATRAPTRAGPAAWRAGRTSAVPGSGSYHPRSERRRPGVRRQHRAVAGVRRDPDRVSATSAPRPGRAPGRAGAGPRRCAVPVGGAEPERGGGPHPVHRVDPADGVDDDAPARVRRLPRAHRHDVGPGTGDADRVGRTRTRVVGSEAGVGGTGVGSVPATVTPSARSAPRSGGRTAPGPRPHPAAAGTPAGRRPGRPRPPAAAGPGSRPGSSRCRGPRRCRVREPDELRPPRGFPHAPVEDEHRARGGVGPDGRHRPDGQPERAHRRVGRGQAGDGHPRRDQGRPGGQGAHQRRAVGPGGLARDPRARTTAPWVGSGAARWPSATSQVTPSSPRASTASSPASVRAQCREAAENRRRAPARVRLGRSADRVAHRPGVRDRRRVGVGQRRRRGGEPRGGGPRGVVERVVAHRGRVGRPVPRRRVGARRVDARGEQAGRGEVGGRHQAVRAVGDDVERPRRRPAHDRGRPPVGVPAHEADHGGGAEGQRSEQGPDGQRPATGPAGVGPRRVGVRVPPDERGLQSSGDDTLGVHPRRRRRGAPHPAVPPPARHDPARLSAGPRRAARRRPRRPGARRRRPRPRTGRAAPPRPTRRRRERAGAVEVVGEVVPQPRRSASAGGPGRSPAAASRQRDSRSWAVGEQVGGPGAVGAVVPGRAAPAGSAIGSTPVAAQPGDEDQVAAGLGHLLAVEPDHPGVQ